MAVSAATLAKKVKATVLNHPSLVARDGTQDVPKSFNFNFGGELQEAGTTVRSHIDVIVNNIKEFLVHSDLSAIVPAADNESKEAQKLRIQLYAFRALYSLSTSPNGILKSIFQVRAMGSIDVADKLGFESNALSAMEECTAVFQFKRHATDDNNPWIHSWILTVEGVSVSRGAKQPIHKLVSSLLKLIDLPSEYDSTTQAALAELAKMKGNAKPYYWYLSNQDTAMWYQAFTSYASLGSCMSKEHSFYSHTGARQHPMDCYDDSPDWSLMFISEQSPEEIIAMCDLALANPSEASSLFKFPWLSRSLVLPTAKETSGRTMDKAPYVMGKFYGLDKLVKFFLDESQNSPYCSNNNGLLMGSAEIEGGIIPAIKSTRSGKENHYMLPYFDKANKARLITVDGKEYWSSVTGDFRGRFRDPIAKCSYDSGSARFEYIWSPAEGGYVSVGSFTPNLFNTIFGLELESYRETYQEHTINGTVQLVPGNMFETIAGQRVLRGEITSLYDGHRVITADVIANPERYVRVEGFGLFDLTITNHVSTHTALTAALDVAVTVAEEVPAPVAAPTVPEAPF